MRRTILWFLGTMLVLLVGAGGVALAAANYYYCPNATTCNCPEGVTYCVGTPGEDRIIGTDSSDNIYAKGGPDGVYPGGGDKCYGGSGVDYLDRATCEKRKQY